MLKSIEWVAYCTEELLAMLYVMRSVQLDQMHLRRLVDTDGKAPLIV